jgi:hypothetical protein
MHLSADHFEEILAYTKDEKRYDARKNARVGISATAVVHVPGSPDGDRRVYVRDISPQGLGLMSTREFHTTQRFLITLPRRDGPDLTLPCEVRFCNSVADGIYHVGVNFLSDGSGDVGDALPGRT